MPQRLRVLISAYACEPHKGSEPEVGWQWALQMARFHDVTVLTRANNRPAIESELKSLAGRRPLPRFVYHDRSRFFLRMKRRAGAIQGYYLLWQRSARDIVRNLHEAEPFDLMHHVTFAAFRYPTAIWGHDAPSIWGPIGGIESIPMPLLPWRHWGSLGREMVRNAHNLLQATPNRVLPGRARATTTLLASTTEMRDAFARLGFESSLMPTIGLDSNEMPYTPRAWPDSQTVPPETATASNSANRQRPLRLLFVGNIISLKGVDLALDALKASGVNASFTLVGDGSYLTAARRQIRRLGLEGQVQFRGRLPRSEVLKIYRDYDVFVFPSLHDTGGYAVIEAMYNEMPVVCLDCGGPAVAVRETCGVRVPLGSRREVITGLSEAIRAYDQGRVLLARHGTAARRRMLDEYDWQRKAEQMNDCYLETVSRHRQADSALQKRKTAYSGLGLLTRTLHGVFSFGGLAAGLLILLLLGALGFASIGHLKRETGKIIYDTLPGLSSAGEADANLAQAFNNTVILLMTEDPAEVAKLQTEADEFSRRTAQFLADYQRAIYEHADQVLFDALMQHRQEYTGVREQVFLLLATNRPAAVRLARTEMLPAYRAYKQAGDKLFQYNVRQGHDRGKAIMHVCTITQFAVAGLVLLIFVAGFFFGLFK